MGFVLRNILVFACVALLGSFLNGQIEGTEGSAAAGPWAENLSAESTSETSGNGETSPDGSLDPEGEANDDGEGPLEEEVEEKALPPYSYRIASANCGAEALSPVVDHGPVGPDLHGLERPPRA